MNKSIDLGLLVMRIGVGGSVLAFRALGSLFGGPELWAMNGSFILDTSLQVSPEIAGGVLAGLECLGAFLLLTGAAFRFGTAMLILTTLPGIVHQVGTISGASYTGLGSSFVSLILLSVYIGFLITGPGTMAMRLFSGSSGKSKEEPLPSFDDLG